MSSKSLPDRLQVFVYGSLKRGCQNHQQFCDGYLEAHEAAVLGRLYRQPSGYPMLVIPQQHVLAKGTDDASVDVAEQVRLSGGFLDFSEPRADSSTRKEEDWQWIMGEVFSFDNASERLSQLDFLEEFHPGEQSLYHRVIATASLSTAKPKRVPVWMYIAPDGGLPFGSTRLGTSWP